MTPEKGLFSSDSVKEFPLGNLSKINAFNML